MLFESPPANFMLFPIYEENLLVTLARTLFRNVSTLISGAIPSLSHDTLREGFRICNCTHCVVQQR